ncbi:MAG TPA: PBP1A family penicillin-binding protein [Kofleriaceae bacterium]|nr:PBP1A family penicillin-binding protein [Kofleriaceae bacterium]
MPLATTKRMWTQPGEPRKPQGKLPKGVGKPRRSWPWPLVVIKWLAIVILAAAALGTATIALVFWMYGRDPNLPNIEKLADYRPKQITRIVDSNDRVIGELGSERRTLVQFDQIPPFVVDAFIAAEDNNFWSHGGVDYVGMVRAFVANLRAGHTKEGASTITQQVVKNLLLTSERSFKRKIQEVILARRLEHALTKQEIMTLYLNQIDFGHSTYGVQEAARMYFGKDISQVNVGEAAMLASLPKEPERLYKALHDGKNPQLAKDRQIYVLNQMVKIGKLSQADAQKWIDAPVQIVKNPYPELDTAPEWIEQVKKELPTYRSDPIDLMGAKVRTTLDPKLQADAVKALQAGLRVVDKRHKIGRPLRSVKPERIEAEIVRLAKAMPAGGPDAKQVYEAVVTAVHDDKGSLEVDLGHYPATVALPADDPRYNPPDDDGKVKKPSERFKPGDIVAVIAPGAQADAEAHTGDAEDPPKKDRTVRVELAPGPQGAVVIMDIKSRKVLAMVGGYSTRVGGFDRATMAKRQPGSSFKPFVYAAAFEDAANRKCHANDPDQSVTCATAATRVDSNAERVAKWMPKNFEASESTGLMRLRTALEMSINTVSVRLAEDVTPKAIAAMAHRMGIQSNLPEEMSLALGSVEVTPLEEVNAYATLAAGGVYAPARFIDAIDGKPVAAEPGKQVMAPELAYVITNMMESVTTEGTAAEVGAKLKIPIAGKTGTSNEARNTWFIGMTPDIVIGVWVGYDDNRPMPGEQGARVAAPIFIDVAKQMNLTGKEFPRPPHVVTATIDRETGLLAPEGAPKKTTLDEVFLEGTQPTITATKPGEATEDSQVLGEYGD